MNTETRYWQLRHRLWSYAGPALADAGPNARPRRASLSNGFMTSWCSVNCAVTFLLKVF